MVCVYTHVYTASSLESNRKRQMKQTNFCHGYKLKDKAQRIDYRLKNLMFKEEFFIFRNCLTNKKKLFLRIIFVIFFFIRLLKLKVPIVYTKAME